MRIYNPIQETVSIGFLSKDGEFHVLEVVRADTEELLQCSHILYESINVEFQLEELEFWKTNVGVFHVRDIR